MDFSRIHTVVISGCGFPSVTNNYEPLRSEFELMIPHDLFMLTVLPAYPSLVGVPLRAA